MDEVREISLKRFLNTFKESCENGERFCFILGSGASKESGIMTGIELAEIWSRELQSDYSKEELEGMMKELDIDDISISSKNYFDIYDLRFNTDYKNGHAYIERMMESAQPSYGYYPLARQLATTGNNLVITTNFDTLVEDSLFIYTDKRPVVVGHELLTEYINYNKKRPIIAKIHRGLYLKPFNRKNEIACLSNNWKEVLKSAFKIYTPIIIGYAGGDNSLINFIKDASVEMSGIYWCYYKKDKLSDEIKELVKNKNGYIIPIDGFDSMMFSLSQKFSYEDPSGHIKDAADERINMFRDKYADFSDKTKSIVNPDESEAEIKEMLEDVNSREIESLKKQIGKDPKDWNAHFNLAYQYGLKKEFEEAINSNSRAIELKPDHVLAYYNRGAAYYSIKEYDKAISDNSKAIELKPDFTEAYNNRGNAYYNINECNKAISDYNRAIELKPDYAKAYNNRGVAYGSIKEYNKAISDYHRAIELKPDYTDAFNNRGNSYGYIKDYNSAISDYSKAIELRPDYTKAYRNRAKAYEALGEIDKAKADIEKADSISKDKDK